ncbi:DUF6895 family protein [Amycolatopsis sp. NPDC059021]|uniref:DUF6895 family protein n=1 Tax=Amycolatopsis sp. NPDC059021 TaxID=3346704 RepID=UPI00366CE461
MPLLDDAVGWLTDRLRWFDPAEWDRFLPPRPFPGGTALELLVLCRVLRRGRFRDHPLPDKALDLASSIVESPSFVAGLCRADQAFPYHAYLVALLEDAGRPAPSARERILDVLAAEAGDHEGAWRPVQHRLELRYVQELGGFPSRIPDLIGQSIVAGSPDPLFLRDDEAYALTHVVFYATDFGARPMPDASALTGLLRTLAGSYLTAGNLDLAGEFLLCLTALGSSCPVTAHGFRVLSDAQRPDGAVPGPLHDPARWSGLRGDAAEAYLFGTCHHTTMVAAMAAAEHERVGGTSTTSPEPLGLLHPSRPPLPDGSPDSPWWGTVLSSLAVHAVRTYDLDALRTVLRHAESLDLADEPVLSRAAAYLRLASKPPRQ